MTEQQISDIWYYCHDLSKEIEDHLQFFWSGRVLKLIYFWQQANPGLILTLWSPLVGSVHITPVSLEDHEIVGYSGGDIKQIQFTPDGKYIHATTCAAECILFPSEEERDWNNFEIIGLGMDSMSLNMEDILSYKKIYNRQTKETGTITHIFSTSLINDLPEFQKVNAHYYMFFVEWPNGNKENYEIGQNFSKFSLS